MTKMDDYGYYDFDEDVVPSVAECLTRIRQFEKLHQAALQLRNSGYDGPFIGDVCTPLFDALADLEKA